METLYIDTPQQLEQLVARLRGETHLALDSEFLREKTYSAQLCLLQVASDELIALVDPLALTDLSPLLEVFYDTRIVKIMHSAWQDLEIFLQLRDTLPAPVFDTQNAAALLGLGDQVGYANLVQALLHVSLEKSQTRTDWSRRPLDAAQLHYAADDVRYLPEIYRRLRAQLEQFGRLHWLDEDFAALSDPATYRRPDQEQWRRVKGANNLKGVQLAVLQELAAWRERTAIAADRPRRWIVKDEVMLDISRRLPETLADLARFRGLEDAALSRHGASILECVAAGRQRPPDSWPEAPVRRRLEAHEDALIDVLMGIVRLNADRHRIAPALLATRKDLEGLIVDARDSALYHGWRKEVVGNALRAFLAGQDVLRVQDGALQTVRAAEHADG